MSRKSENNLQAVIAKLQKYSKIHCERTAFTIYNLPQVVEKLFCNSNVGANVVYFFITNADTHMSRITAFGSKLKVAAIGQAKGCKSDSTARLSRQ